MGAERPRSEKKLAGRGGGGGLGKKKVPGVGILKGVKWEKGRLFGDGGELQGRCVRRGTDPCEKERNADGETETLRVRRQRAGR